MPARSRAAGMLLHVFSAVMARFKQRSPGEQSDTRGDPLHATRSLKNQASQLHLPGLAHQIDAKTVMLLLGDLAEAGLLVDSARGEQAALRPQRHLRITLLARGADALLDQRAADAEPACLSLDHQQAKFCDLVGAFHQAHRSDGLAAVLGDPTMRAGGIVAIYELRADLGDQRLVADVPAILLGIGDAL